MPSAPYIARSIRLADEALARLDSCPRARRFAVARELLGYLRSESPLAAMAFRDIAFAVAGGDVITFVRAGSTFNNVTTALGATATAGHLLVAQGAVATTAVAVPSGWSNLGSANGSLAGRMVYKISDGTETGITWASAATGLIAEYSGVDTVVPNIGGAAGVSATASSTSHATASITPTTGRIAVVVTIYLRGSSTVTWSAEAITGTNAGAAAERLDANGQATADALVTSTSGAYSGSATLSATGVGSTGIAIFQSTARARPALTVQQAVMRAATR